jgi:hypothetical protein
MENIIIKAGISSTFFITARCLTENVTEKEYF